jgi:hypothetical protein
LFYWEIFLFKFFRRENDCVVFVDEPLEEFPEPSIWICEVDMAPPNPGLCFLAESYEGYGLWIMNNYAIMRYVAIGGKSLGDSLNIESSFYFAEVY